MGPTIGSLHYSRSAAGDHNQFVFTGVDGNQVSQFTRFIIITAVFQSFAGCLYLFCQHRIIIVFRIFVLGRYQFGFRGFRIKNPGTAEYDHRRLNMLLLQNELGFKDLQLQSHRPQFIAQQKLRILKRHLVTGGSAVRRIIT